MNKFIVRVRVLFAMGIVSVFLLASCSKDTPTSVNPGPKSDKTGLEYASSVDDEGFPVLDYKGQPKAPGMVYVEGGRTVLGSSEEDVQYSRDNIERTVSIQSFYMDETEVANINWLEYIFYLKKDSVQDPNIYISALPDTTVWAGELQYNDPYTDHYLRYPGFRMYPVVGVNWDQAQNYCKWRSSVVNYKLAEDAGIDPAQYASATGGSARIPLETGVVVPDYRLPTEAEWEYAALALIGTSYGTENQAQKRLYPWDGHSLRNPYDAEMGNFLCNFKRGRGDYAGIAGKLNDGALITDQVYAFPPNDFNLYCMAGNVNEWVYDVYRPLSFQDFDDLNPVRRNGYLDETAETRAQGSKDAGYDQTHSLINDNARVYKGGSWRDVAYWMSPGTRRFLAQDSSTNHIGFRCAMIHAGRNY